MEEEKAAVSVTVTVVAQSLIDVVNEIASVSDYRTTVKKLCSNLARRLKLLVPMFEEIRESNDLIMSEDTLGTLVSLREALSSAKDHLKFCSGGSKIYLVMEKEQVTSKLLEVSVQLEQSLSKIPFEDLDISDEVKEQVELVLSQFRRAKGRVDASDDELYQDLQSLCTKSSDVDDDYQVALQRVAKKLQLMEIPDLAQESVALHEMVALSGGGDAEEMTMVLKRIKDFVQMESDNNSEDQKVGVINSSSSNGQTSTAVSQKIPVVPDDFRCPISLEMMRDPVIVSTGQTYERTCIEKWIEAGHSTCPKTQQALTSTTLTPNYVLRSLIAQWCEANDIEPPKPPSSFRPRKVSSFSSPAEANKIEDLMWRLAYGNPEDQRSAAGEIRLLAKRNADNRVAIAEAGAIPLLVGLLATPDSRIQEHSVTALLNLSICENNKGAIVSAGAIPGIVQVLKKGSMEARENAAATLFSLSVIDENKVTIGVLGAIPPLVVLLNEGTQRGKKDAATALFNLCIYQGNKGKAIRAGVVPTLTRLLTEPGSGMVDEALAILAILSSHPEGKAIIGSLDAVPSLVEFIRTGSPRNRENAAAVLVHLSSGDNPQHLVEAQKLGLMGPLIDLAGNGTDRGKRKAAQLLERISRLAEQQKETAVQEQTKEEDEPTHSTSTTEAAAT
ncbi:U-box domain-containing protein 13 [Raphanus sativus]|uniref:RING-type E3 ubiquitin transferase n=1 Tax=Raphanus sativus TaxID=3726 RepID=A0A6J0JYE5_RAPSA|nr:U-box domain-containing protein 13 [Raphanus sativus]KAJ4890486.1 U-box domain-containing protein 13 [Raphanus sativus]